MKDWSHDELAADVLDARHLVGEIAMERLAIGALGQLDVVSLRLSWTRPRPTGYEVKISRSDFLRDVRAAKWRKYLGAVERLFFCVPKGMVDEREVPPECGLMTRGERRWRTARVAPEHKINPNYFTGLVQALLFRHYPAEWQAGAHGQLRIDGVRVSTKEIREGKGRDYLGREIELRELVIRRKAYLSP